MKESDSDHDLRIDLETEIEEYKPQFVVEAVRQEDVDLEIDYSASHSTHVPLYQQTRPDVPLQLEEPQALPEQEEPQHSDVSPGGSQNSSTSELPAHSTSNNSEEVKKEPALVFYNSKEMVEKKQRAIIGALLAGGTSALIWGGFQFASFGILPRALVVFVGCFAAAGSGLGQLKEDQSRKLVLVCGMTSVFFALLAWAYFGYASLQQLHYAQQNELLSYYGIKGKAEELSLLTFVVKALSPFDILLIIGGGFVANKSNKAARW